MNLGIVPVIKIDDADKAVPLAKALLAGGVDMAEITFRTAAAEAAIKNISAEVPEILVGAGTVVSAAQAGTAASAGAKFLVSPGLSEDVVNASRSLGLPILPGILTPSELMKGLDLGLSAFKFFPSETFGGLKTLKALAAPFGSVRFVPTGGIDLNNIADYWAFEKVAAVGGSFIATDALIKAGNWLEVTNICERTTGLFRSVRGEKHA
jgi:2-dehydro-3-deoxyphosphogluconate aldolase/(4S)-4-hydroxy-2-oxoglutarate aldolase